MTSIVVTLEQACRLYSILPHELDDASMSLLREDFNQMCLTVDGKPGIIIGDTE